MNIDQLKKKTIEVSGILPTPCWLWQSYIDPVKGYGRTLQGKKHWQVHRLAFTITRGPIPDGLTLDHLCNPKTGDWQHRACCNPEHLEPVPAEINTSRGNHWNSGSRERNKTQCRNGHAYTEDNIYWDKCTKSKSGAPKRKCKKCHNERRKNARGGNKIVPEARIVVETHEHGR